MKKQQIMGSSMLLVTSLIWGGAFVAQKIGMEHIGPFTFCGIRFLLSAVFLILVVITRDLLIYKKLSFFSYDKKTIYYFYYDGGNVSVGIPCLCYQRSKLDDVGTPI